MYACLVGNNKHLELQSTHLGGHHGLVLGDDRLGGDLNGVLLEVTAGGSREVGLLDVRGGLGAHGDRSHGIGGDAAEELLGLGGVVAHVLLGQLSGLGRVLASNGAELASLLANNVGSILDLRVDELLVGAVDEGDEEEGAGGSQGKTPERHDLDEVVGEESTDEGLEHRVSH